MKDSFTALKLALSSKPVLHAPDFDKPFYLQTDACNTGIGAILCQMDENVHEHPIVYLSRQLLPREKNYSTIEKECLVTVWAVQQLHYYLASRKFTILSDHKPLAWLQQRQHLTPRLTRWSLALQPYTFDTQYNRGSANSNADALSRLAR